MIARVWMCVCSLFLPMNTEKHAIICGTRWGPEVRLVSDWKRKSAHIRSISDGARSSSAHLEALNSIEVLSTGMFTVMAASILVPNSQAIACVCRLSLCVSEATARRKMVRQGEILVISTVLAPVRDLRHTIGY